MKDIARDQKSSLLLGLNLDVLKELELVLITALLPLCRGYMFPLTNSLLSNGRIYEQAKISGLNEQGKVSSFLNSEIFRDLDSSIPGSNQTDCLGRSSPFNSCHVKYNSLTVLQKWKHKSGDEIHLLQHIGAWHSLTSAGTAQTDIKENRGHNNLLLLYKLVPVLITINTWLVQKTLCCYLNFNVAV